MPIIGNTRRTRPRTAFQGQTPATPRAFVDAPKMEYRAWLERCAGGIAALPNAADFRVAVVGSGAAGLAAGYELLRCGVNVTVYEAGGRIGGRLFTSPSSTGDGNVFEMGAMRFTPSEQLLHYYADLFTASGASRVIFDTGAFPDPGENLTYIAFQGKTYVYDPALGDKNDVPPSFWTTSKGWNAFLDNGFTSADGTIRLTAPNTLTGWLADAAANAPRVQKAWQAYIDAFANATLYEAMVRIFTDANAPGGMRWSETDFEFYGALGTGFGGMGPLFPICFLDIIRFTINAVDSDQHELVTGVDSLVNGFLDQPVPFLGGACYLRNHVATGIAVTAIAVERATAQPKVLLTFDNGLTGVFDRVVVATSHRSMELTMGLGASHDGVPLAESTADAVRRLHLENSSKVFAETAAFWNDPTLPRNVVGDTILRNFYTLTYPQAPADTGSLLFSYTWADDSVKQQTFTDPAARLKLLLRDLATISPHLAEVVETSITPGTVQLIDWQNEPYFFGAFKLNQPGQDPYVQTLFYDFQKAGTAADTGVYLAGDSIGFLGGWVENALQTGVNAAAAVMVSLGATLNDASAGPFKALEKNFYTYSTIGAGGPTAAAKKVPVPGIVGEHAGKR